MFDSLALGIRFRDSYGMDVNPFFNLMDEATIIEKEDYKYPIYIPRAFVEGYFRIINKYQEVEFIIAPGGTHRLLISHIPWHHWFDTQSFRYKGAIWTTWWQCGEEHTKTQRWLFQVMPKWEGYFGSDFSNQILKISA